MPDTLPNTKGEARTSFTRKLVSSTAVAASLLLHTPVHSQFLPDAHSQNIVSIARLGQQITLLLRDMESKQHISHSDLDRLSKLLVLWWPKVVESRRANFEHNLSLAESARGMLIAHGYSARELPKF